jgi:hypothetical protein
VRDPTRRPPHCCYFLDNVRSSADLLRSKRSPLLLRDCSQEADGSQCQWSTDKGCGVQHSGSTPDQSRDWSGMGQLLDAARSRELGLQPGRSPPSQPPLSELCAPSKLGVDHRQRRQGLGRGPWVTGPTSRRKPTGTVACSESGDGPMTCRTGCRKTRVIWQKLNCLNRAPCEMRETAGSPNSV